MQKRKSLYYVLFLSLVVSSLPIELQAQNVPIAVVRDTRSPYFEQLYFAFAASAERDFVTYNLKRGEEAEIAKAVALKGARVVFLVGEPDKVFLEALDKQITVLCLEQNQVVDPEAFDQPVVKLGVDIGANQMLDIIAELVPESKRIGIAYNPKLTKTLVDSYRQANRDRPLKLVLLKIDQPTDVGSLMPSFRGKIDLFLLLKDATVIKAGLTAVTPFLTSQSIPMVSTSRAFKGLGSMLTISLDPVSLGRNAWQIAKKMLGGQRTFKNEFEKRDIVVSLSLKEAKKLKYASKQTLAILERATSAGYHVEVID